MNMNHSSWSASIAGSPTPSLQSDINVNRNVRMAVPVLDINVAARVVEGIGENFQAQYKAFKFAKLQTPTTFEVVHYSATLSTPIARPTPLIWSTWSSRFFPLTYSTSRCSRLLGSTLLLADGNGALRPCKGFKYCI